MTDLNRQQKRMAKRQGFVDEQGDPVRERRQTRNQPRPGEERVGPFQFMREVRGELRKVSWPRREEVVNSPSWFSWSSCCSPGPSACSIGDSAKPS